LGPARSRLVNEKQTGEAQMGELELFEPGTQIFTGTVRSWSG
jgi:hypothetical protein